MESNGHETPPLMAEIDEPSIPSELQLVVINGERFVPEAKLDQLRRSHDEMHHMTSNAIAERNKAQAELQEAQKLIDALRKQLRGEW